MEEPGRDGRPGKPWVGLAEPGERSGQLPGGQGCMASAESGYQSLEKVGRAVLAWVPEPWPCTQGRAFSLLLYVVLVTKSMVWGHSLPGFGPGSTLTSHVSPGKGHNSPKR